MIRRLLLAIALLLPGCAAFSSDCAEFYVCPTLSIGIEIPLARKPHRAPPEPYYDDEPTE